MSLIPRDAAVAARRRLYQPEANEGDDLRFFSETLNAEQVIRYNRILSVYTESKRLKMTISQEDLQKMATGKGEAVLLYHVWSLLPRNWVFDCVIHYVMKEMPTLLGTTNPAVAFFSSFFFTKLFQEGQSDDFGQGKEGDFNYKGVESWTKKRLTQPIDKMKTLIFFRNQSNMHWVVYAIFIDDKTIQEFNSLPGGKNGDVEVLEGLYTWLEIEMLVAGTILNKAEWQLLPSDSDTTPKQRNSDDCGIFMLLFGVCIAQGLPLGLVSQERVATARSLLILHWEIIIGRSGRK